MVMLLCLMLVKSNCQTTLRLRRSCCERNCSASTGHLNLKSGTFFSTIFTVYIYDIYIFIHTNTYFRIASICTSTNTLIKLFI